MSKTIAKTGGSEGGRGQRIVYAMNGGALIHFLTAQRNQPRRFNSWGRQNDGPKKKTRLWWDTRWVATDTDRHSGTGWGEIRHQQGDEPRQLQRTGKKEKKKRVQFIY